MTRKWFRAKNIVFREQCIAINQSVMWAHICLSQQYGLKIIWQFWHVNNCQISGAVVLINNFSDFFK